MRSVIFYEIFKKNLIGVGGGCFFQGGHLQTFRNVVFGYNSNSHHDPLIVSFLLFIFVISKVFSIFSIDNRPIMCHVTLSMMSSSRKWQHFTR